MSYYTNNSYNPNASTEAPKKVPLKIFNTFTNKYFETKVFPWMTVAELKHKIERDIGMPPSQQRLFVRTQELTLNNSCLVSYGINKKCIISLRPPPNLKNTIGHIKRYEALPKSLTLKRLVFSVQEGFNLGLIPKMTLEGTSGAYFLRNTFRKNIGIFKPVDEEPFAPNNPKGYKGKLGSQGFRRGVLSGESGTREVAAYLLEVMKEEKGFFGIPPTTFVEVVHPYFENHDLNENDIEDNFVDFIPKGTNSDSMQIKHGSLQSFVENAEESSDYSHSCFPDEEVRKIAILDILILNCDRNEGNILVKRGPNRSYQLIPIDHGLSFPDAIDICSYELVWTDWPQIQKPFTEREMHYINKLNPKEDAIKLSKYLRFRSACLRNFRIAATLLLKCAKAGMTIADIASLIYKDDPDCLSPIEKLIKTTESITSTMKSSISRDFLDGLTNHGKRQKMAKYYASDAIKEEKQEKKIQEKIDYLKDNTLKDVSQSSILSKIVEEASPSTLEYTLDLMKARTAESANNASVSRESTDNSQDGLGSDDSDDLEEPGEIQLKKSNSKALKSLSLAIMRNISLPNLIKEEQEKIKDDEEVKEDEEKKKKKAKLHKVSKKNKDKTPPHLDDLFFHYFEVFLDQKIQKLQKKKLQL